MPNHDWPGRSCNCRECGTTGREEVCPKCGFSTLVELVGVASRGYDRKGAPETRVTLPEGPPRDLSCRKCGFTREVPFYSAVDEEACQARLERDRLESAASPCGSCGARVEWLLSAGGYAAIPLKEHRGQKLCSKCFAKAIEAETPDPSTTTEKYGFNPRTLQWEVVKVRQACVDCGRARWLNVENRWQRRCNTCYRNAVG
jgi:hypothetical protein